MDVQLFPFEKLHFEKLTDKTSRRYVSGEKATLANFQLKKGAIVPEHHHPNEQISYVLNGCIKVTVPDKDFLVHSGEVIIIPSNIPHQFEAVDDSLVLDVFCPIREDWINGTDTYLK